MIGDFGLNILAHLRIVLINAWVLAGHVLRGTRTWIVAFLRLIVFVTLLIPGWFRLIKYYITHHLIIKNIEYGKGHLHRNVLDIYLPLPSWKGKGNERYRTGQGARVVIFFSGGAWTIGYKFWSALVARGFTALGYLVVVPDYRNFPQGDVKDMVQDVTAVLRWTVGKDGVASYVMRIDMLYV